MVERERTPLPLLVLALARRLGLAGVATGTDLDPELGLGLPTGVDDLSTRRNNPDTRIQPGRGGLRGVIASGVDVAMRDGAAAHRHGGAERSCSPGQAERYVRENDEVHRAEKPIDRVASP